MKRMRGAIGERIAEWRKLLREGTLEAMERFLKENDDLKGFFEETGNARRISRYGSEVGSTGVVIERNQKYIKLTMKGIPDEIARLMSRNPDIVDVSFESVVWHYNFLVGGGVSEVAAAAFASTDYTGRGSDGILERLATDYHVISSGGTSLELPFYMARYRGLFRRVSDDEGNCKELGIAFHVIDGLYEDYEEEVAA